MCTESSKRIIAIIQAIPRGKVLSYSQIALQAGIPNGARQVARLLHSSSKKYDLPWHRVVKADGSIALPEDGGADLQKELLRQEGVVFSGHRKVDMSKVNLELLVGFLQK